MASNVVHIRMDVTSLPLHTAAAAGDVTTCCLLVKAVPSLLESTDAHGRTALHAAAERGQLETLNVLTDAAPHLIAARDSSGLTALHLAAGKGHADVCRRLVQQGSDVSAASKNGWTPVHCAAEFGHADVLILLCAGDTARLATAMGSGGCTPVHFSALGGHVAACELLLSRGASLDYRTEDGMTALHAAVAGGHMRFLEWMWSCNAEACRAMVVTPTSNGMTPLFTACALGRAAVCEWLLERGARVTLTSRAKGGLTPLHVAAAVGAVDVCARLIDAAPDDVARTEMLMSRNDGGWLPLHSAAEFNQVQVCQKLLDCGANANVTGYDGWTPLHVAASSGAAPVCTLLLTRGGDPLAVTDMHLLPLHCAAWRDQTECVQVLVRAAPSSIYVRTGLSLLPVQIAPPLSATRTLLEGRAVSSMQNTPIFQVPALSTLATAEAVVKPSVITAEVASRSVTPEATAADGARTAAPPPKVIADHALKLRASLQRRENRGASVPAAAYAYVEVLEDASQVRELDLHMGDFLVVHDTRGVQLTRFSTEEEAAAAIRSLHGMDESEFAYNDFTVIQVGSEGVEQDLNAPAPMCTLQVPFGDSDVPAMHAELCSGSSIVTKGRMVVDTGSAYTKFSCLQPKDAIKVSTDLIEILGHNGEVVEYVLWKPLEASTWMLHLSVKEGETANLGVVVPRAFFNPDTGSHLLGCDLLWRLSFNGSPTVRIGDRTATLSISSVGVTDVISAASTVATPTGGAAARPAPAPITAATLTELSRRWRMKAGAAASAVASSAAGGTPPRG